MMHSARKAPRLLITVNMAIFFLTHRLAIAEAARDAGWDVHIATPDQPEVAEIRAAGFTWHELPMARHGQNPVSEALSILGFARLFRQLRPDIVHNVTLKPAIYGGIAARLAGVPACVSAIAGLGLVYNETHSLAGRLRKWLVGFLAARAFARHQDRVIFQNDANRDEMLSAGLVRPHQVVMIRGSGVDITRFVPTDEPAGPPVITLAGRWLIDKGLYELAQASRLLKAKGLAFRIALVGRPDPGNDRNVPDDVLQAWADEGLVELWGQRRDMPGVLAQSHIVCTPSSCPEGMPKINLEAMGAGRPLVTTDWQGCRDTVPEGRNGIIVPAGDAPALAAALERLITDPGLRLEMGREGRKLAKERFSSAIVAQKHLELWQGLCPSCAPVRVLAA